DHARELVSDDQRRREHQRLEGPRGASEHHPEDRRDEREDGEDALQSIVHRVVSGGFGRMSGDAPKAALAASILAYGLVEVELGKVWPPFGREVELCVRRSP